MNYFKQIVSFLIALNSLLIVPAAHTAKNLDRIVAVVNTHVITQQELTEQTELIREQLQAENKAASSTVLFRKQVLDHLIDRELQRQLAANSGLTIDETALDKTIADIAKHNHLTVAQLRDRLEQDHLPYTSYRHNIREQLLLSRLQQDEVGQKITVSPQEITDMLGHMPAQAISDNTLYHVEDLRIPLPDNPSPQTFKNMKKTALSLLQHAKNGDTFQALHTQASNESLSLSHNDLGWRPLNELPDIFQSSLRTSRPGEIVGPLQAQNGFHLLRVLAIRSDEATSRHVTATRTRHILIKTSPLVSDQQAQQRLKEIRAEILRGGRFTELAKQYSQDPSSAFKGGELGWTLPGIFDPTFEAQMNKLPLQAISLPFRTPFGWHIVQVLGRSDKIKTRQSLLHDQAAQLVYQKKFQRALQNWLHQLRQQSYVKIMDH